jgi:hypothetical protein
MPPTTGRFTIKVSANDGAISPVAALSLSIGGFSLTANPTVIVAGVSGTPFTTVTATFTGGFNQGITVTCPGLPSQITCSDPGALGAGNAQETLSLMGTSGLTPNDYPFQIVGTSAGLTQSVNATLRVEGMSGSINPSAATLSSGNSANFKVTLTSLNHFANSVTVSCQNPIGITCSTSGPASLADNGTANVTLTVAYQPPVIIAYHNSFEGSIPPWLCLIAVPVFPLMRRKRIFGIAATIVICLVCNACGGSGSPAGGGGPTQTLSVPVVANATNSDGTLQVNIGVITVTVQQ